VEYQAPQFHDNSSDWQEPAMYEQQHMMADQYQTQHMQQMQHMQHMHQQQQQQQQHDYQQQQYESQQENLQDAHYHWQPEQNLDETLYEEVQQESTHGGVEPLGMEEEGMAMREAHKPPEAMPLQSNENASWTAPHVDDGSKFERRGAAKIAQPPTTLLVRGLPPNAVEENVRAFFGRAFVGLGRVTVCVDQSGQCKGHGFADMANAKQIDHAMRILNGVQVDGCRITFQVYDSPVGGLRQERAELAQRAEYESKDNWQR